MIRLCLSMGVAALWSAGCGVAADDPGAVFEAGLNDPELALPAAWMPVSNDRSAPVVLGMQGSLMVVGAVRTNRVRADVEVTVTAALEDAETGLQRARIKFRRALQDGGDGYAYLRDAYLVLGAPNGDHEWQGRDAVLTLSIEYGGEVIEDACVIRPEYLPAP